MIEIQEKDQLHRPVLTKALGIDFGTTLCGVALCDEQGHAHLIGDLIPSVVAYTPEGVRVGKQALDFPSQMIGSVKRLLSPEKATMPLWDQHSPFDVAKDLFIGIKDHIITHLGAFISQAVVTVPAYFDESRRQIVKKAAESAGFHVLRLVSEPTAAALCYRFDKEGLYAIYDLGGGTFDFSILRMKEGLFRVIATGGHPDLGGDDIDGLIAHSLFQGDPQGLAKARALKENASQTLLSSHEFNELVRPLIEATLEICTDTLKDADLTSADLNALVFVGGSTKLSLVQKAVAQAFSCPVYSELDPDQSVALGAALYAYHLTHETPFLLLDVTPLSLGIETWGGLVEHMIPRNTPLPAQKEMIFTTGQDGQTKLKIQVVQGESELVAHCRSLGTFELTDIPALSKGQARIAVSFQLDEDGLLLVHARETSSGKSASLNVNAARGLSYDHIATCVDRAGEDVVERILIQKVHQAQEAISEVRRLLSMHHHDERVENACLSLTRACESQDLSLVIKEWDIFSLVVIPFIERYLTSLLKDTLED
jgi:molecular chaperone HscA